MQDKARMSVAGGDFTTAAVKGQGQPLAAGVAMDNRALFDKATPTTFVGVNEPVIIKGPSRNEDKPHDYAGPTAQDYNTTSQQSRSDYTSYGHGGSTQDTARSAGQQAQQAAGQVGDKARDTYNQTASQAKQTAGQVGDKARDVAGQAQQTAGQVGDQARDTYNQAASQAQQTAGQVGDKARDTYNQAASSAQQTANQVGDKARDVAGQAQQTASQVGDKARDTYNQAASQAQQTASQVGDKARDTYNQASAKASDVAGQAQQTAQQAADSAYQRTQQAAQATRENLSSAATTAQEQAQRAAQQAQEAAAHGWEQTKATAAQVHDQVAPQLSAAAQRTQELAAQGAQVVAQKTVDTAAALNQAAHDKAAAVAKDREQWFAKAEEESAKARAEGRDTAAGVEGRTAGLVPDAQNFDFNALYDLIMWRNPTKSGMALGAITFTYLFLEWTHFNVISTAGWALLGIFSLVFLWNNLAYLTNKPQSLIGTTLKQGVSEQQVQGWVEKITDGLNDALHFIYRAIHGGDVMATAKMLGGLYLLSKFGSYFSAPTMLFLLAVSAFIFPKIYEARRGDIQAAMRKARAKGHQIIDPMMDALPQPSRAAGTVDSKYTAGGRGPSGAQPGQYGGGNGGDSRPPTVAEMEPFMG